MLIIKIIISIWATLALIFFSVVLYNVFNEDKEFRYTDLIIKITVIYSLFCLSAYIILYLICMFSI